MMTDTPLVTIIVVSYNTKDMTLAALQSLKDQTTAAYEVIVVDNASKDGSAEAIAKAFPEMKLLAESDNHGFAKANNMAARYAKGTYLLLLNPDTVVLDGAIDRLLGFAQRVPNARIWGGKTLYGDLSLNPTNCWAHFTLWSLFCRTAGLSALLPASLLFNPESYGNWDRSKERDVGFVTGCFFLIKRDFWSELSGFDLRYIMFGEEADLCRRAALKGARPRVTPDASIIHYVGASTKSPGPRRVMMLAGIMTQIEVHYRGWHRVLAKRLLEGWAMTRAPFSKEWREAWQRRSEWRNGYPPL